MLGETTVIVQTTVDAFNRLGAEQCRRARIVMKLLAAVNPANGVERRSGSLPTVNPILDHAPRHLGEKSLVFSESSGEQMPVVRCLRKTAGNAPISKEIRGICAFLPSGGCVHRENLNTIRHRFILRR